MNIKDNNSIVSLIVTAVTYITSSLVFNYTFNLFELVILYYIISINLNIIAILEKMGNNNNNKFYGG